MIEELFVSTLLSGLFVGYFFLMKWLTGSKTTALAFLVTLLAVGTIKAHHKMTTVLCEQSQAVVCEQYSGEKR